MKFLLYSLLFWLPANGLASPPNPVNGDPLPVRETVFYAREGNPDWLVIRDGILIPAQELLRNHKLDLGLTEADELQEYRVDTDELGFTHRRYRQYHKGVKVHGGELLIHEKDGYVQTLNGKLVRGLQAGVATGLAPETAIDIALAHTNAARYMWESPAAEALLRRIKRDPDATYYPRPEMMLVNPSGDQNPEGFQMAWSFVVFAEKPQSKKQVFVGVADGKILLELELLHDQNTPGTAHTKYSGERSVITDSTASNLFRLSESTRGGGIETLNMNKDTEFDNVTDFTDTDNIWNNVNIDQDEAATDAFWGAEMTFDYYLQKHGHSGIDGFDMPLISLVHYDENWVNARWTGDFAQFGDGNSSFSALTSLDVVCHEFTHGVTDYTANLIYQNESGALNESFSDIFGAAVEFWATPEQADWLIGEDFAHNSVNIFRNMKNPKAYSDPDTYKGDNWATGTADNGGVHTNSGVQNRWFALLTDGGSGTNDNNDDFLVNGVGLDTAAGIAFRNLKYYLIQFSEYNDARLGSLQAALDLYGPCSSVAYLETANAWYAVGLGERLFYYDLNLLDVTAPAPIACKLGDSEFIAVRFKYNNCSVELPEGSKIPMSFSVNDGTAVWDTLTLSAPLKHGDTVLFTFNVPTNAFATPGVYKVRCTTGLDTDLNVGNNDVEVTVESILEQNVDMGLRDIRDLVSGCFLGAATPKIEIGYFGCDTIAAGAEVTLFLSVNGGAPVSETVQIPQPLHLGETFLHTLSGAVDLSAQGAYAIDAWVQYGPDFLPANDSVNALRVVNPYRFYQQDTLTFEAAAASLDSSYSASGRYVEAVLSADAARSGARGLRITGGDMLKAYEDGDFVEPADTNVWIRNEVFRNKFCICADLTDISSAQLQFDLRQTFSTFYLTNFGKNNPWASTMRVLVNGNQESVDFKPSTFKNDPWKTRTVDLAAYSGSPVEICFQTHTALNVAFDPAGIGDKVLLDNIIIKSGLVGTGNPETKAGNWSVYPNPGTGEFILAWEADHAQELLIEIADGTGRTLRSFRQDTAPGKTRIPLDMSGEPAGVYFIRLISGQSQQSGKITIR